MDIAKIYAKEVAKQALKDAADNVVCENNGIEISSPKWEVDKDSILNTEIITP